MDANPGAVGPCWNLGAHDQSLRTWGHGKWLAKQTHPTVVLACWNWKHHWMRWFSPGYPNSKVKVTEGDRRILIVVCVSNLYLILLKHLKSRLIKIWRRVSCHMETPWVRSSGGTPIAQGSDGSIRPSWNLHSHLKIDAWNFRSGFLSFWKKDLLAGVYFVSGSVIYCHFRPKTTKAPPKQFQTEKPTEKGESMVDFLAPGR